MAAGDPAADAEIDAETSDDENLAITSPDEFQVLTSAGATAYLRMFFMQRSHDCLQQVGTMWSAGLHFLQQTYDRLHVSITQ